MRMMTEYTISAVVSVTCSVKEMETEDVVEKIKMEIELVLPVQ